MVLAFSHAIKLSALARRPEMNRSDYVMRGTTIAIDLEYIIEIIAARRVFQGRMTFTFHSRLLYQKFSFLVVLEHCTLELFSFERLLPFFILRKTNAIFLMKILQQLLRTIWKGIENEETFANFYLYG